MTKKDYIKLAQALKDSRPDFSPGDNNGRGEFAPIIRQWTGRNIKWPFEKGA